MDHVWIFNGTGGIFPAAVFSSLEKAELWIAERRLNGTLTQYPVDLPIYDWAIGCAVFKPKRPDQSEPKFIQRFSSASQEHYHYENGVSAEHDGPSSP